MRKINCFFIVFIMLCKVVYTQGGSKADSLVAVLAHAEGNAKTEILLGLSSLFINSDPEKCNAYCDTILNLKDKPHDTVLYKVFSNSGTAYTRLDKYYKAIEKHKRAMEIAENLGREDLISREYYSIGINYISLGDLDEAEEYLNHAIEIDRKSQKRKQEAFCLSALGHVFKSRGDYDKAIECYMDALAINEELGSNSSIAHILNKIGSVYIRIRYYETAQEYYEKALEIRKELGNKRDIAGSLNNVGMIYQNLGEFDKAMNFYQQALEINREIGNKRWESYNLGNMGETFFAQDKYQHALDYFNQSLEIKEGIGDKMGVVKSLIKKGKVYIKLKKTDEAMAILKKGLTEAREIGLMSEIKNIYLLISDLYSMDGNNDSALVYYRQFSDVKDSILGQDKIKNINRMQTKYITDSKEKVIEGLNKEKALQESELKIARNIRTFFIITSILILLLAAVLFNRYRIKNRANKLLSEKNQQISDQNKELEKLSEQQKKLIATKDKFFSIIAHDLKNPFNAILGLSDILIQDFENLENEDKKEFIEKISNSSAEIYKLLENLLEWARSQSGGLDFKPEITQLDQILSETISAIQTQADGKKVKIRIEKNRNEKVYADQNMLRTVFRNLISNGIKFSKTGDEILISSVSGDMQVVVTVSDSGIGISNENLQRLFRIDQKFRSIGTANEKGTGLGLILCREFIEKNGGKIWVESEPGKGSKFIFTLPKPPL